MAEGLFWENLLKEFSKKPSHGSSVASNSSTQYTIIVLGDISTGKLSFLQQYSNSSTSLTNSAMTIGASSHLLSYDYLNFDEQKINLWILNERNYSIYSNNVIEFIKGKDNKAILSIMINLSSDDCLYSLRYWFNMTKKIQFDNPNLSLPIVVIGCKSDLLNLNDGESLLKARSLQGKLRYLCLKNNAALVFSSSGGSDGSATKVNVDTVRNLWLEMFTLGEDIPRTICEVKEGMMDLVVPLGADSESFIAAATGLHNEPASDERDWAEWLKKRESQVKNADHHAQLNPKDGISPLLRMVREAEEEEDQWLQSLRDELGPATHTADPETSTNEAGTPSILDTLAAAPSQKPVSRRASSHVSETPLIPTIGAPKSVVSQQLQKKRSSVALGLSEGKGSSSTAATGPSSSSGGGKEVKTFFESFLPAGSTQKK